MKRSSKYRWLLITGILFLVIIGAMWISLPDPLFRDPTSTVLEDQNGVLLGARIAEDGQWRFPMIDEVPDKFKECIVRFEDRYFFKHPGINPVSILRAAWQNINAGRVVQGGSTLSMQVIRLSRKGKPRTIFEKIIEVWMAMSLEMHYSKSEILRMYATYAPYGGNVVGLETASWRYYGRSAHELSWSETAMLAVLPNAPSLIYPGKNQERLLAKRNRLLDGLNRSGVIDSLSCNLALMEGLPGKPGPLEQLAPHLLDRMSRSHQGQRIRSTLDARLQKSVNEIVERHHRKLRHNNIFNAAALVVKIETGEVVSYVGNARPGEKEHGNDVDIVMAPRSSGSVLKPILYAAMLDKGMILPNTLIADVPTQIGSFNPMNFDRNYSGAVPAKQALSRSLNVPAVKMLQEFGVHRFQEVLQHAGISTLTQSSNHYGLSLILGGAEVNMFDLATVFCNFSRVLRNYSSNSGRYAASDLFLPVFISDEGAANGESHQLASVFSASAIWYAYEAMQQVVRPQDQAGWDSFSSSESVAWKTGTSFGFRDAWAVGTTSDYVVVVWVGNADGEGRPGLTGTSCAAPILFDIFNLLPDSDWFDPPFDEMTSAPVCRESGHRAGPNCSPVDTVMIPGSGLKSASCPYHVKVHLDKEKKYQVSDACYDPANMCHESWFVLPAVMEWYYKQRNPGYRPLPPVSEGCSGHGTQSMEFVYPGSFSRLYIPINLNGRPESVIMELAHRDEEAVVYWYLDDQYLGQTRNQHQMEVHPEPGEHQVLVVDQSGKQLTKFIEVLDREAIDSRN